MKGGVVSAAPSSSLSTAPAYINDGVCSDFLFSGNGLLCPGSSGVVSTTTPPLGEKWFCVPGSSFQR